LKQSYAFEIVLNTAVMVLCTNLVKI